MDLAIGLIIIVAVSITSEKYFLYSSFCSPFHSLCWHLQDTYFAFLAVHLLHPVFETTHHILGMFSNIEPLQGGRLPLALLSAWFD